MESQIEETLIEKLVGLKYVYRTDIRDRKSLDNNFREKFNLRNYCHLSDGEFDRLLSELIEKDVFKCSKKLREQQLFYRDDGSPIYYNLFDTDNWCKNTFEVVNQLKINTQNSNQRYDVVILINGLPLVQIELKNHGINPRKAMQQIIDYKQDKGNGYLNSLLCFIQLFIVSNQSETFYFTNNNDEFLQFDAKEQFLPIYHWADTTNNKINDLDKFADCLLDKYALGEMLSKYMVLVNTERRLLIMRPYQIYAVKAIVNTIDSKGGNGYIWHTTGSGKTLTSFKASTLLKSNADIYKCLFVVDRKDLDRQTRQEFNKFQDGCVEENTNTETLVWRLLSNEYSNKVIVTTIQKLYKALTEDKYKDRLEGIDDERFVFIFDECHRSQFGDNNKVIKQFFPNSQMFGFTGTPIFDENAFKKAYEGEEGKYMITKDIFDKELHKYTITHAIEDNNVLRFHVDYFKPDGEIPEKGYDKIAIVKAILAKHDKSTANRKFNAFFATASINDAIEYYKIFKEQQRIYGEQNPDFVPLNITCVFTPPVEAMEGNEKQINDIRQLQEDLPQEKKDNENGQNEKKAALEEIIEDYNKKFVDGYADGDEKAKKSGFSIQEFDIYYQDVQMRIKNQKFSNQTYNHKYKLDIVIVVDMLLTGFDSKYLNTLYLDKNLKYHSLIQAFSRTNRILNDTKPQGNILVFRNLQNEVDDAVALFSGEEAEGKRTIWLVEPKEEVIKQYKEAVGDLEDFMHSQQLDLTPDDVYNICGNEAKCQFINDFKLVQKLKTKLDQYTDITDDEQQEIEDILTEDQILGFKVAYLETAKEIKFNNQHANGDDSQNDDYINNELDFEFVLFASVIIDYDYIMQLITTKLIGKETKQKLTKQQIVNIIKSSSNFMEDGDDLIDYVNSLNVDNINGKTVEEVKKDFENFQKEKFNKEITDIAAAFGLQYEILNEFVEKTVNRLIFDGDSLTDLFEPQDLGWRERVAKEKEFMARIAPLLKRMAKGKDISGLNAWEE
jgi:type I restriction enzyme R subunit